MGIISKYLIVVEKHFYWVSYSCSVVIDFYPEIPL